MNMELADCLICERIELIEKGKSPYLVKRMKSGYVVMGDSQYFNGYTLLLHKKHTDSLLGLSLLEKFWFFWDLLKVYKAVFRAFKPVRLNVELLGNTDHHLHWHIFPRYNTDIQPQKTIWAIDRALRNKKASRTVIKSNRDKLEKEL